LTTAMGLGIVLGMATTSEAYRELIAERDKLVGIRRNLIATGPNRGHVRRRRADLAVQIDALNERISATAARDIEPTLKSTAAPADTGA